MNLRVFSLAILLFFLFSSSLIKAEVRPLDYDRYDEFSFIDSAVELVDSSTPQNLTKDDDLRTVGIKFLIHNLKQLKKNMKKTSATASLKFEEIIDAEFRLKADLPHGYIKFRMITDLADGEMLYSARGNKMVVSLSKNIFPELMLSLVDTKNLSNSHNAVTLNLSYNF